MVVGDCVRAITWLKRKLNVSIFDLSVSLPRRYSLFLVSLISGVRVATGYMSLPPGGRPSSTVLYPGPPSSSPRPPTPPFSCLSRCNRAISYVVFLSFSFPSPGEHMPSLVVDLLSFVLHVLSTSTEFSPIFPSNTSYTNLLSQLVHPPPVHSLHSSNPPHPVVFTHLQSMFVFLGHR